MLEDKMKIAMLGQKLCDVTENHFRAGLEIAPLPQDTGFNFYALLISGSHLWKAEIEQGPPYRDPYKNVFSKKNGLYILSSLINIADECRARFHRQDIFIDDKIMLRDEKTYLIRMNYVEAMDSRRELIGILSLRNLRETVKTPLPYQGPRWTLHEQVATRTAEISTLIRQL